MPYNQTIDKRIRKAIATWQQTSSRKMFGGVCHLRNGNMFCGVHKDYLILRLGESSEKEAMSSAHVRPFDITGKPMKGWVMVEEKGFETEAELKKWLNMAKGFVDTLPPKLYGPGTRVTRVRRHR